VAETGLRSHSPSSGTAARRALRKRVFELHPLGLTPADAVPTHRITPLSHVALVLLVHSDRLTLDSRDARNHARKE
jgi:hypothetical protein